jgi:8-oxo-dGTP diphosphatase
LLSSADVAGKHHNASLAHRAGFVNVAGFDLDRRPLTETPFAVMIATEMPMKRDYPAAPIVAVGVIVRHENRILLVQRGHEPSRGLWTFPGGAIELGESLHEAVRREALEETGLDVEVEEVATVIDNIVADEAGRVRYHYVIVDFFARPAGGALHSGSDAWQARWFSLAELDGVEMTEKAGQLARKYLSASE